MSTTSHSGPTTSRIRSICCGESCTPSRPVAATVTGNPAWVILASTGCFVVMGPDRTGCARSTTGFETYFERIAPSFYQLGRLRFLDH